jgi:hypothetical protein
VSDYVHFMLSAVSLFGGYFGCCGFDGIMSLNFGLLTIILTFNYRVAYILGFVNRVTVVFTALFPKWYNQDIMSRLWRVYA